MRPIPIGATLLLLFASHAMAVVRYVDVNGQNPTPPYTNWMTAATSIQDSIDASSSGDLILVTNGVYASGGRLVYGALTNRVVINQAITVQSVNGPGATVIQGYPVIGSSAVRCVYLTNGAALTGFTLANGATAASGDFVTQTYGGGVWCESTNSTISNCVINANSAQYYGGGAYAGTFFNCTFAQNYAPDGGGGAIYATLINCVLNTNSAYTWGGGAYYSTLNNCTLDGNSASEGGGAAASTLSNCWVFGNSAGSGGGAWASSLYNCSISSNSASSGGGVQSSQLSNCTLTGNTAGTGGGANAANLSNCIVYFNFGSSGSNYSGSTFDYCCTSPLPSDGTNNIASDPALADFTHLSAGSLCIGAGNAAYASGVDIDGDPWANPPSMGCDEFVLGNAIGPMTVSFQASYTNVPVGFAVSFAAQISGHATANAWDFGDGTVVSNLLYPSHIWTAPGNYPVVFQVFNDTYPAGLAAATMVSVLDHPVQYVALTSTNPVAPFLTWNTAATNIQDAVDVGYVNGTILVSNGVYNIGGRVISGSLTNRLAITSALTVQSVNGPAVTIIQGYQVPGTTNGSNAIRCVYLTNNAALIGFTLTNGATQTTGTTTGGGAWCASTNAVLSNCVLAGNSAYGGGGGAFSGTLNNCSIIGNSVLAPGNYPGAGPGGPVGGGVEASILNNCKLIGNIGFLGGGATAGTLNNCVIVSNSAAEGGGVYNARLNNCSIASNSATNSGGGIYLGTLNNCIIYDNSSPSGPNYGPTGPGGSASLNFCCTIPLPAAGTGSVTNDPLFVNLAAGDLHLQSNSPCINSGRNAYVSLTNDLDGNPRIVGGTVDMGAYEFQTPSSVLSYAWAQQYGLPTDGSVDYADSDGTGMNNWQKWIAGLNPTNPASVLAMMPLVATNNLSGVVVTWQSVNTRTYYLQRSTNLAVTPAFTAIQSNITGQAGTTSFTDSSATNGGPYFYRVGVQ